MTTKDRSSPQISRGTIKSLAELDLAICSLGDQDDVSNFYCEDGREMCRSDNGGPDKLEHCRPVMRCGPKLLCVDGRSAVLVGQRRHGSWDRFSECYVLMPANPEDLPETFQVECRHISDVESPGL